MTPKGAPRKILVLGKPVQINYISKLPLPDRTDAAIGQYQMRLNRIDVADLNHVSRRELADSVLHEVLHAAIFEAGLPNDILEDFDDHEQIVNRLTPILLDILIRNPRLTAFLLAE